ncbi:hypothetical protein DFH08DRAFT_813002 [Mycena albidolilacea]|uniref:Uncharacterized protein n=1 Tax=Mycena albidolilacea TaxID=1033008 RepID=A0AAD7EMH3_9AGAR|nr:hypothetical protein DFH08DRAFT_813002 [Mycena albidolilacea]
MLASWLQALHILLWKGCNLLPDWQDLQFASRGFRDKQFPFWEGGGGSSGTEKKNRFTLSQLLLGPQIAQYSKSTISEEPHLAAPCPVHPARQALPLFTMQKRHGKSWFRIPAPVSHARARWDYKTNMTLGACREHTGRNIPLNIWDAEMLSQELQGSCGGGKWQRL